MAGFHNNPTFSAPKPMEELGVYGVQPVPNDYSSLMKALENTKATARASSGKEGKGSGQEEIKGLTGVAKNHSQKLIQAENKMSEVQKRYGGDAYVASLDPEFRQAQSDYMMLNNPERNNTMRRQEENYKSFQTANKDLASGFNIDMFNRALQGDVSDKDVFAYDANGGVRLKTIGEDLSNLENSRDEKFIDNYSFGYKATKGIEDLQVSLNKLYEGLGQSSSVLGQNGVNETIRAGVLLGGRFGTLKEGFTAGSQEDRDNFQQRQVVAKRWKEFAYDPQVRDAAMQSFFNSPEGKNALTDIKRMEQSLNKDGKFTIQETVIKVDKEGNPITEKKKDKDGKQYEVYQYETVDNTYSEKDFMKKRKEYIDGQVDRHIKSLYEEDNNKRKIEDTKRIKGSKQMDFAAYQQDAQNAMKIEQQLMLEGSGTAVSMSRTAEGDLQSNYVDRLGPQGEMVYKNKLYDAMAKIRTQLGKPNDYELTVGEVAGVIQDDKYMRSLFAGLGDMNILSKYAKDAKIGRFLSAEKSANGQFLTVSFDKGGAPDMADMLISSQEGLYGRYGLKVQANAKYATFDGNDAGRVDNYWNISTASSLLQALDKTNPRQADLVAQYMKDPTKYIEAMKKNGFKSTGNFQQDSRIVLSGFAKEASKATGKEIQILDANGEWTLRKAVLSNPIQYQNAQRATGNSLVAKMILNGIKPEALENVTFKVADEMELQKSLSDPLVKKAFIEWSNKRKKTETALSKPIGSQWVEKEYGTANGDITDFIEFTSDPASNINGTPIETYMKSINKWKTKTVKAFDPAMANQPGYDEKGILIKFNDMQGGNVDVNEDGTLNIVGQIEAHRIFDMPATQITISQQSSSRLQEIGNIQQYNKQ